jgi:hypothetical protein
VSELTDQAISLLTTLPRSHTAAGSHVHFTTIGGVVYPIYSHVWEMSAATNYFVYNGT